MKTFNLSMIAKTLSDESDAYKFLESVLWKDGVVCPHCGAVNQATFVQPKNGDLRKTRKGSKSYRRIWNCNACRKVFSVLVGTIFEDSHIPLSKWFIAIHEMCAAKNGVSALELSRKLRISYRPAWHMAHRIRFAITRGVLAEMIKGTVEADETYIGGKAKNMHRAKREKVISGRGTVGKTPVFTIVERGGDARSQVVGEVNGETVRQPLMENVDTQATLNTDTSPVYNQVGKEFAKHETVDHIAGEYVRGKGKNSAHINTAEGYFSQLKRSINGVYHHVSTKHLDRYLAEFDYRYSTRKSVDGNRTMRAIEQTRGKRLQYRSLTQSRDERPAS